MIKFIVEPESKEEKSPEIHVKVEVDAFGNVDIMLRENGQWVTVAYLGGDSGKLGLFHCKVSARESLPGICFEGSCIAIA